MMPSDPKLNIFALPNQTTVFFLLIVSVVLGVVLAGSVGAPPSIKSLAIALLALPARAFLARPERRFARYRLTFAGDEFPELRQEVVRLAQKIGLRCAPRIAAPTAAAFPRWGVLRQGLLVVAPDADAETQPAEPVAFRLLAVVCGWYGALGAGELEDVRRVFPRAFKLWGAWYLAAGRRPRVQTWWVRPRVSLHIFGTFRRRYLAMSREEAETLRTMLADPGQAPTARAQLIHELYHFQTGDYWQLGYAGELLRLTFLVMLWAAVFFIGLGLLLIRVKPVIAQLGQFVPMLQQTIRMFGVIPKELFGVFDQLIGFLDVLVGMLQQISRDAAHLNFSRLILFSFGAVYPYTILGLALWLIYWPKLWRMREFYADAGVVQAQRTTLPYQAALTGIPLPFLQLMPQTAPAVEQPVGRCGRISKLWGAVKQVREFHPSVPTRLRAVAAPAQVFGAWQDTAFLVGTVTVLLEILMLTPLTLIYVGQMPMHFPTLAALLLIGLTYLLPALAQGKAVQSDLLKIVGVLTLLRFLVVLGSILIFVVFWWSAPAQFSAVLDTISATAARAFRADLASSAAEFNGAFLFEMAVLNLAQVALVAGVLLVALKLLTFLLRRLWRWYSLPRAERRLVTIAYGLVALVTILVACSVLPVVTALLLDQDALVNPLYTRVEVFGLLCFVCGLLIFNAADRRYAGRCPSCGAAILDAHAAGSCCPQPTCQHALHPWLSVTYGESRSDAS
jgi:hypothetical protein